MLFAIPVPVAPVASQSFIGADVTIGPSTALTDLIASPSLPLTGVRTRISFTACVSFSGTTNTLRTGTFELLKDGVLMRSVQLQHPADSAAAGVFRENVHIELEDTPTAGAHVYKVQWTTSANLTLTVLATNPAVGYGNLIVEELSSGASLVGPQFDALRLDIGWGNDPKSVAQSIRNIFASRLGVDPTTQLVDIHVEGGGAGATWQVIVWTIVPTVPPSPVVYPALTALSVAATMGLEPLSHEVSILNVFTGTNDELIAWGGAGAGAGANFLDVFVYILGEGGPGLLAERLASPTREVAIAPAVARTALPAPSVKAVTFPPATLSVHTTTPTSGRK